MNIKSETYEDLVKESDSDFQIHSSIYTDPSIFEKEMKVLFESGWCYVAHESEIEKAGDFRTSAIGRIPVLVSRGDDDNVYVNVNSCRHRGTVLCREERGNTRFFVCPYHGWSYKRDGSLARPVWQRAKISISSALTIPDTGEPDEIETSFNNRVRIALLTSSPDPCNSTGNS